MSSKRRFQGSAQELQAPDIISRIAAREVVSDLRASKHSMNCVVPNRFRLFAARCCLLAVASLFAPLAGAVWSSSAIDCCTGDHCTIPKHHHPKAPVHADCDHGNGTGLTECSMSCCQDEDRPFATTMNFVMPPTVIVSAPTDTIGAVDAPR
jgi:hypothetical protein